MIDANATNPRVRGLCRLGILAAISLSAASALALPPRGPLPGPPPLRPDNLTMVGDGHVATLRWRDNSSDETAFLVYERGIDGPWRRIGSTSANVTTFTVSRATGGPPILLEYQVTAYHAGLATPESLPSNVVRYRFTYVVVP